MRFIQDNTYDRELLILSNYLHNGLQSSQKPPNFSKIHEEAKKIDPEFLKVAQQYRPLTDASPALSELSADAKEQLFMLAQDYHDEISEWSKPLPPRDTNKEKTTKAIAQALADKDPKTNVKAYLLYLKGMLAFEPNLPSQVRECINEAKMLSPEVFTDPDNTRISPTNSTVYLSDSTSNESLDSESSDVLGSIESRQMHVFAQQLDEHLDSLSPLELARLNIAAKYKHPPIQDRFPLREGVLRSVVKDYLINLKLVLSSDPNLRSKEANYCILTTKMTYPKMFAHIQEISEESFVKNIDKYVQKLRPSALKKLYASAIADQPILKQLLDDSRHSSDFSL